MHPTQLPYVQQETLIDLDLLRLGGSSKHKEPASPPCPAAPALLLQTTAQRLTLFKGWKQQLGRTYAAGTAEVRAAPALAATACGLPAAPVPKHAAPCVRLHPC